MVNRILAALLVAAFTPDLAASISHGNPYQPVGDIDVDNEMVRRGVSPLVSWKITYPETVTDFVDIDPESGQLVTSKTARMKIRVAGVAFQSGATHLPVTLWSDATGTWQNLFFGKYDEVEPNVAVFDQIVPEGMVLNFAARGQSKSGRWYSAATTLNTNPTCVGLKDGDEFPENSPAYGQGTVKSFLTPFIGQDGRVDLGPLDLIYLFECYATSPLSTYYDLQDLVMVVTFENVE